MQSSAPLLEVRNLCTAFPVDGSEVHAVRDVSFALNPGQILGIVGESGSGKSVTARSVMGMLAGGGHITAGEVLFHGRDLVGLDEEALRHIRGRQIAMVFQDPQAALNPIRSVGWQIREALRVHGMPRARAHARAIELLALVGIPEPEKNINAYPHQFSGGMRQRVVIAIAIANSPQLIIADEPTTALDVTIQAQVLRLLIDLRDRLGAAVMMITHDMGVVAELCDAVIVMYGGRIVERGRVAEVFARPAHPYTRALLQAMPRVGGLKGNRLPAIPGTSPDLAALPQGCAFHPRCALAQDICRTSTPELVGLPDAPGRASACHLLAPDGTLPDPAPRPADASPVPVLAGDQSPAADPILSVTDLRVSFPDRRLFFKESPLLAVDGVSLDLAPGETLGLVGESGSGKTTLARTLVGINRATEGQITIAGCDVTGFDPGQARAVRSIVQYVFQDPYASLNPRLTVRQSLGEALEQRGVKPADIEAEALALLDLVGLGPQHLDRFPHAFSGGQRQRIGIARALAAQPQVLICDEPVSALDLSVQAQVINVLADLRDRLGLAILFIAHDLAVVRHFSKRIAVMYLGRIVETGTTEEVFAAPRHPYTAILLASTPQPDAAGADIRRKPVLEGEPPDPRNPPSGCRFRTRCPIGPLKYPDRDICARLDPALSGPAGHRAACHFPDQAGAIGAPAPIRSEYEALSP